MDEDSSTERKTWQAYTVMYRFMSHVITRNRGEVGGSPNSKWSRQLISIFLTDNEVMRGTRCQCVRLFFFQNQTYKQLKRTLSLIG